MMKTGKKGFTKKMIVDQELCKGCGVCIGVCPNDAIYLQAGIANIDQSKCTNCQICIDTCPYGALQLEKTGIPATSSKPKGLEVIQPQPAQVSSPSRRPDWSSALLSFVGRYALPCFIDALAAFVERRLSSPVHERSSIDIKPVQYRSYRQRRRNRGRYL
jgi:ferredoxin